ncbi:hypothetical protein LSH36_406g02082 [Paralvinella palmiformis]|uniref:dCMP deaminase n=1 Tax=Paralvinella palmiformis TaxID=53620 RepID=A0AAD9N0E2_9ANNE|nr:hypothetical protein LSH36_406g02082 [Paralvinella palmiformis]
MSAVVDEANGACTRVRCRELPIELVHNGSSRHTEPTADASGSSSASSAHNGHSRSSEPSTKNRKLTNQPENEHQDQMASPTAENEKVSDDRTWPGRGQKRSDYLDWSEYFMAVALLSGERSKDPSMQVGACIVDSDNRIVAIGYNGMPANCPDECMPWAREADDALETKYPYVCHAEMNAILNKNSAHLQGCVIYVALFPCNECAKLIVQSAIRHIVYTCDKYHEKMQCIASRRLFDMAGITYEQFKPRHNKVTIDLRHRCCEINGTRRVSRSREGYLKNSMRLDYITWSEYFVGVALLSAQRSKDPKSQVGACIVSVSKRIVAIGYNGMPRNCDDDRLPWTHHADDPLETKYPYVCHAELNAIMNRNCMALKGCTMYVTRFPCNECAKLILQAGISSVIYLFDKHPERFEYCAARRLFDMARVEYKPYKWRDDAQCVVIDFTSF